MQVGDKVYTYYREQFGTFPLELTVVEGEILSVEEKTLTNIQGEEITKTIVEIKASHAGKKYLFDGIAEIVEDAEGRFEWACVFQQTPFFNYWYKEKSNCYRSIELELNTVQQQINERFKELEKLNEGTCPSQE